MRLALWTPRPRVGWWGLVVPRLARRTELRLVEREPPEAPDADVCVYDVANDPAHGFVYRALRRRDGIVVLESWNLHRLVHAETAGHGDVAGYRREARRTRGETGTFVAQQVLAGRGGALPSLLPLNDRVLDASLALAATSEALRARAAARLGDRPVVLLPAEDPGAAATALLGLAAAVSRGEPRGAGRSAAPDGTPLALALDELRPAAHALALAGVPREVRELLESLFPEPQ